MNSSAGIKTVDVINGEDFAAVKRSLPLIRSRIPSDAEFGVRVFAGPSYPVVLYDGVAGSAAGRTIAAVRLDPDAELPAGDAERIVSTAEGFKLRGHLHGSSVAPILAALPEFERRGLDLSAYKIELMQEKNAYIVVFSDKNAEPDGLGNTGSRPALEVDLDARTQRVTGSHFVR